MGGRKKGPKRNAPGECLRHLAWHGLVRERMITEGEGRAIGERFESEFKNPGKGKKTDRVVLSVG